MNMNMVFLFISGLLLCACLHQNNDFDCKRPFGIRCQSLATIDDQIRLGHLEAIRQATQSNQ